MWGYVAIIFGTLVSTHQYSKTCLQGTSLYKRRCPYIIGVNQVSLHHRFLNLGEAGGGGGGPERMGPRPPPWVPLLLLSPAALKARDGRYCNAPRPSVHPSRLVFAL